MRYRYETDDPPGSVSSMYASFRPTDECDCEPSNATRVGRFRLKLVEYENGPLIRVRMSWAIVDGDTQYLGFLVSRS